MSERPPASLSSVQERIDPICLAFEDAWQEGTPPEIEAYLERVEPSDRDALLRELLRLQWEYAGDAGGLEAWQTRFPDRTELLAEVWSAWEGSRDAVRAPGSRVGRFRIRRLLGSGAFSHVYLADDEQLGRPVALKIDRGPAGAGEGPPADRRRDEARILAQLDHPGIVPVYDAGTLPDGAGFLVMQWIDGDSLTEHLQHGPVAWEQACRWIASLADAVGDAHRRGLVHCDLKPSNVLVDGEDRVYLVDFGLALRDADRVRQRGQRAGTPAYMAPEQLRGDTDHLDGRADLWSLGVMLYRLVAGTLPFSGATWEETADAVLRSEPRPLRQWTPAAPARLERVCRTCLAKDPGDRYVHADALEAELRQLLRQARWRRRARWAALGGLLVVLVLLAAAAAWRWGRPAPGRVAGRIEVWGWRGPSALPGDPTSNEKVGAGAVPPASAGGPRSLAPDGLPAQDEGPGGFLRGPRPAGAAAGEEWRDAPGTPVDYPGWLPAHPGDLVRIELAAPRPYYLYAVWLEADGSLLPLYPWREGDRRRRPRDERRLARLSLPGPGEAWPLRRGPAGMETVLLLGRDRPLPADVSLEALLGAQSPTPLHPRWTLARFRHGLPVEVSRWRERHRERGPSLVDVPRSPDRLFALHEDLARRLAQHFEMIEGFSFAFED